MALQLGTFHLGKLFVPPVSPRLRNVCNPAFDPDCICCKGCIQQAQIQIQCQRQRHDQKKSKPENQNDSTTKQILRTNIVDQLEKSGIEYTFDGGTHTPFPEYETPTPRHTLCCKEADKFCLKGEGEIFEWYFAIGSMCNPTSLMLRNIYPAESHPAILYGYKLVFDGESGMASILELHNLHFHGVLHRITETELEMLDKIESGYDRVPVTVTLYDGRTQRATVYKMSENKIDRTIPSQLPSERYLDIISRGLRYYNVCESYIQWLLKQPCIRRKQVNQFSKIYISPSFSDAYYTIEQIAACDGNEGRDLCFVVNGKVMRWIGNLESSSSRWTYEWLKNRYAGQDITVVWACMLYEPCFPVASCLEKMQEEHKAFVEDMFVERMGKNDSPLCMCIGRVDYRSKSTSIEYLLETCRSEGNRGVTDTEKAILTLTIESSSDHENT